MKQVLYHITVQVYFFITSLNIHLPLLFFFPEIDRDIEIIVENLK